MTPQNTIANSAWLNQLRKERQEQQDIFNNLVGSTDELNIARREQALVLFCDLNTRIRTAEAYVPQVLQRRSLVPSIPLRQAGA